MMRLLGIVVGAFLLTACSSGEYRPTPQSKDPEGTQSSLALCEIEAEETYPTKALFPTILVMYKRESYTKKCMRALGYEPSE